MLSLKQRHMVRAKVRSQTEDGLFSLEAVSPFLKWSSNFTEMTGDNICEVLVCNKNSIMLSPIPSPCPAPNLPAGKLQQTSGFLGRMSQMESTLFLILVCLLPRPQSWGEGRRLQKRNCYSLKGLNHLPPLHFQMAGNRGGCKQLFMPSLKQRH